MGLAAWPIHRVEYMGYRIYASGSNQLEGSSVVTKPRQPAADLAASDLQLRPWWRAGLSQNQVKRNL